MNRPLRNFDPLRFALCVLGIIALAYVVVTL